MMKIGWLLVHYEALGRASENLCSHLQKLGNIAINGQIFRTKMV